MVSFSFFFLVFQLIAVFFHLVKVTKGPITWRISSRAEIFLRFHVTFSDFQARLAGLKILARFEYTGIGFLARAELRPGLNPSPCNRQFDFQRICSRSRAEIRHVIRPLKLMNIGLVSTCYLSRRVWV